MKRLLSLSLLVLLISLFLSKTAIFATTAEEEDHGGDIYYTKPVKAVIFSHKAHSVDIGMQCEWCHDETFEMEALAVETEENFDMESFCNGDYCGTCHNGDISFSITEQCARCHIGVKGYERLVKQGEIDPAEDEDSDEKTATISKFEATKQHPGINTGEALENVVNAEYFPEEITMENTREKSSAVFSHNKHLGRESMKCTECHPHVFNMKVDNKLVKQGHLTMEQMEKGKYCGVCHDNTKAFGVSDKNSCRRCHPQ